MKNLRTILILLAILAVNISSQVWQVQTNPASGDIIRIYAIDSNLVYALTSTQVLKTTNGGVNWVVMLNAPPTRSFWGFQWDLPNKGYLWFNNWTQYLKTTDGGANWVGFPLPSANGDMQFTNDTNNIYFINPTAFGQNFYFTTNTGSNWYTTSLSSFTINVLNRMYFVNQQTGFVNGGTSWTYLHRLLRTTDRGFSWTSVMSSSTDGYEGPGDFQFFGNLGYHVSNHTYKTTNMGDTWTQINTQSGGRDALFMHDPQWGWLGKTSGLLKTTDGCATWVNQNIGVTGININSVTFINYNTGWIGGEAGHILKTTNGSGVIPPAQSPVLTAPPNNSTGQGITPLLQWTSVPGAVKYRVQVSVDVFGSTVLDYDTVSVTQLQVPPGFLNHNVLYYWRVAANNIGGQGPWSVVWNFRTGFVGIEPVSNEIPGKFMLYQNYPNPFNPVTKIKFDIPEDNNVTLGIYNSQGRLVSTPVNQFLKAGKYSADFDGSNLSSGIYFVQLKSKGFYQTLKMILTK